MRSPEHLCRFCQSPMRVSDRSYEENPFCAGCYDERVAIATAGFPPMEWVLEGDYMVAVPLEEP